MSVTAARSDPPEPPDLLTLPPGARVLEFEIERVIGRGGFSIAPFSDGSASKTSEQTGSMTISIRMTCIGKSTGGSPNRIGKSATVAVGMCTAVT